MENEKEQLNNTPVADTEELESSITELVEVIKQQEEIKQEEQVKQEEQLLLEQEQKELEMVQTEEQKLLEEEQALAKEKADSEFKEQVLQSLQAEAPSQIDYTEQLNAIVSSLDEIKQNQLVVSEADHVINLYGLIVLPAVIIIFVLWKIIKPFLP